MLKALVPPRFLKNSVIPSPKRRDAVQSPRREAHPPTPSPPRPRVHSLIGSCPHPEGPRASPKRSATHCQTHAGGTGQEKVRGRRPPPDAALTWRGSLHFPCCGNAFLKYRRTWLGKSYGERPRAPGSGTRDRPRGRRRGGPPGAAPSEPRGSLGLLTGSSTEPEFPVSLSKHASLTFRGETNFKSSHVRGARGQTTGQSRRGAGPGAGPGCGAPARHSHHRETPPPAPQGGHHQTDGPQRVCGVCARMWRTRNPCALPAGIRNDVATARWLLRKFNKKLPNDPAIPFLGTDAKERTTGTQTPVQHDHRSPMRSKGWEKLICSSTDEQINRVWYIQTMDCDSARKRNEIRTHPTTRMNLGNIVLASPIRNDKSCVILFI